MSPQLFHTKNKIIGGLYRNVAKKIFFLQDPEVVHDKMNMMGRALGKYSFTRMATRKIFSYQNSMLEQTIHGIRFPNPVGLSAGFDKNAEITDILEDVGFGFVEVGSITGEPCKGNDKPRLWRLPKSQSLVVYYGLKNDGCEAIAARLQGKHHSIPWGVSIAKTNSPDTCETEAGIKDYLKAYTVMGAIGDYDTINISCPNTFGGEPFTEKNRLDKLLTELNAHRNKKPMFIKISPDLNEEELNAVIELAQKHQVQGIISSNLTKKRQNDNIKEISVPEKGGLSGKVVEALANKQIETIYRKTHGTLTIIGVGGIFSAEDAYKKIRLGASLVQLITGMIYQGPQLIGEINEGLVMLLKRDGFKHISEARGKDVQ